MNRFLRASAFLLVAGLGLAAAPSAQAAFITGNQGLADSGTPTLIGSNNINTATGFNFGNLETTTARDGGFRAGAPEIDLRSTTFTPANPTTFTLGVGSRFGTFRATSDVLVDSSSVARSYLITGFFTPGSEFGGGSPEFARLAVSFTQVGGPGTAISDSATLTVPVPEPASIAMIGLGLAGVAGVSTIRRRRASN